MMVSHIVLIQSIHIIETEVITKMAHWMMLLHMLKDLVKFKQLLFKEQNWLEFKTFITKCQLVEFFIVSG